MTVQLKMPRYYFDTFDDDTVSKDGIGLECPSLNAVREQAALSLAELARDVLRGSVKRRLIVKVRDEHGPVLEAKLTYEAIALTAWAERRLRHRN